MAKENLSKVADEEDATMLRAEKRRKLHLASQDLLGALISLIDSINPHSFPDRKWNVNINMIGSKTMPKDNVIIKALQAIKKATEGETMEVTNE